MSESDKYKCPTCGVVAGINFEQRKTNIHLPRGTQTFPVIGHACELAKAIDKIDLSKLEKLG